MYVMNKLPPEQQSVAGGIFNTITRLVMSVGLAVQTSVYNGAGGATEPPGSLLYRPYQATVWVALVAACIGLFLVPLLTLGRQGHHQLSSS
jgi:hypothetical protein